MNLFQQKYFTVVQIEVEVEEQTGRSSSMILIIDKAKKAIKQVANIDA